MKTITPETLTPSTETEVEAVEPLKLSLRSERLKNLSVRSGVKTGRTCGSGCSIEDRWGR